MTERVPISYASSCRYQAFVLFVALHLMALAQGQLSQLSGVVAVLTATSRGTCVRALVAYPIDQTLHKIER